MKCLAIMNESDCFKMVENGAIEHLVLMLGESHGTRREAILALEVLARASNCATCRTDTTKNEGVRACVALAPDTRGSVRSADGEESNDRQPIGCIRKSVEVSAVSQMINGPF